MAAKGPNDAGWGWKKWTALGVVAALIIFGPTIGLSTAMFENYLEYCEANKGTDFSKWLHLKVASISSKTMRPELSAKASKLYWEWYHDPEYTEKDTEDVYRSWVNHALRLEDDNQRLAARKQLEEWKEWYGHGHPYYEQVDQELRNMYARGN